MPDPAAPVETTAGQPDDVSTLTYSLLDLMATVLGDRVTTDPVAATFADSFTTDLVTHDIAQANGECRNCEIPVPCPVWINAAARVVQLADGVHRAGE